MMEMTAGMGFDAATEESDDLALARRAADGDRGAFSLLLVRHYDFIHAVAWKWCRDRTLAEDIAQTVCMRLGGSIRSWRGDSALRTWLYRLTINAAHDQARATAREKRRTDALAAHMSALEQDNCEAEDDTADALWLAVRSLPDKQRDAVLLVYGEDLNHAQAAQVMDCAESTVSYHLHAARKRLKQLLGAPGDAT